MSAAADRRSGLLAGIPPTVIALGVVSLCTDVASEMLVPVLPLFITVALGASATSLGVIEGVAESAASGLRLATGWVSDRMGTRKPFLVAGYGLSGAAKGLMAFALAWPALLALRFADRVGKALRTPPRDALLADVTAPGHRGRAFGLHRSMDTLGAAIGPLVAWWLMRGIAADTARVADFQRIFLVSLAPSALAVVVLVVFVRGREGVHGRGGTRASGPLGGGFARFLAADVLFALGNSSNAFLLLRAQHAGFAPGSVALLYLGYNIVYALLGYPLGRWSDRIGRRPLIAAGYALHALVYAALAVGVPRAGMAAMFAAYGVHSALMDGQQKAFVADLVPPARRGTAYGAYHAAVGIALLPASIVAGALWDRAGAAATFGFGAACAVAALVLLLALRPQPRPQAVPA